METMGKDELSAVTDEALVEKTESLVQLNQKANREIRQSADLSNIFFDGAYVSERISSVAGVNGMLELCITEIGRRIRNRSFPQELVDRLSIHPETVNRYVVFICDGCSNEAILEKAAAETNSMVTYGTCSCCKYTPRP